MNWLTLKDGSKWPDPNEDDNPFHPSAKAYRDLIMGDLTLDQIKSKISLIRQAAGRPRIPPRKSKKVFLYNGELYTWKEIAAMGIDGFLTRDVIVARQRAGKTMEEIISTPVRKFKKINTGHKGFATKADHYALHECTPGQRKTLGI